MRTLINIDGVALVPNHWAINGNERFIAVEHSALSSEDVYKLLSAQTKYHLTLVHTSMIPSKNRKNMTLDEAIKYVRDFRFKRNIGTCEVRVVGKVTGCSKIYSKVELEYLKLSDTTRIRFSESSKINIKEFINNFKEEDVCVAYNGNLYLKGHYEVIDNCNFYKTFIKRETKEVKHDIIITDNFEKLEILKNK